MFSFLETSQVRLPLSEFHYLEENLEKSYGENWNKIYWSYIYGHDFIKFCTSWINQGFLLQFQV